MNLQKNMYQFTDSNKEDEDDSKSNAFLSSDSNQQPSYEGQELMFKKTIAVTPLLQNIQMYQKVMLCCDAPFDIRYFSNQTFYDDEYQSQYKKIVGIKDFKVEKVAILDLESFGGNQVKDPSVYVKQLKSLSSQEAFDMAEQIEKNYEVYTQQLRAAYNLENKGKKYTIDRDKLQKKSIELLKKTLKHGSKIALINIISMDLESMEMKKIMVGATHEFGNIILDKKEQLRSAMLKLGTFNFGGDMKNFTKHQLPLCENREVPFFIHTLDGFIIPSMSRLHTIPLDEQNLNILLIKQFTIQPNLLERLKEFRQKMTEHGIHTLMTQNQYGDKCYINLSQQNLDGMQFENFSFSADQFKLFQNEQQNQHQPCQQVGQRGQYRGNNVQRMDMENTMFQNVQDQEQYSTSTYDNNIFSGTSDQFMMSFEPPNFEESKELQGQEQVSQSSFDNQQPFDQKHETDIQQSIDNTKQFFSIIEDRKKKASPFINKFYSTLIK